MSDLTQCSKLNEWKFEEKRNLSSHMWFFGSWFLPKRDIAFCVIKSMIWSSWQIVFNLILFHHFLVYGMQWKSDSILNTFEG